MAFLGIFGKKKTIVDLVNGLPKSGLTVRSLQALDFAAPGEWKNPTDFDQMMRDLTGETDGDFLNSVRARAIQLYADEKQGYQKALSIYERVDSADRLLGTAAFADKVGEKVKLLQFLDKITPAADTSQAIDLVLKVISELLAFRQVNGLPGDGIADFAAALGEYAGDSKIRMAALVAFDGVIPLGPDFLMKCNDTVSGLTPELLKKSAIFGKIIDFFPKVGATAPVDFVKQGFEATSGWLGGLASGLDRGSIVDHLRQFVEVSDDKLDYLGAFLDVMTTYYSHTGTQSIATRVIQRAVNEV
jgi:hypothetical protein